MAKEEPVVKPKTEQQVLREFFDEYKALCEKHQCQIVVNPAFQARDDGSWSVVLQTSVGKLPQQQQRSRQTVGNVS